MSITEKQILFCKKLTAPQQANNKPKTHFFCEYKSDNLVDEIPVALVYNGISHTVMMCSAQDLEDFALGFSLAEGIIDKPSDIYGIEVVPVCNGIELQIEIATRCFVALKALRRTMAGRTGCGICGTEQLAQVQKDFSPLPQKLQFDLDKLDDCLAQLNATQKLGKQTGASHAAAFFNHNGELLAIREDVGRHVALDKLLGWHAKTHPEQGFVLVTSRASYEMVQKTVACGIEMLIAMSAATTLAVDMATQSQLTLIGFAREGRATLYSHPSRLINIES